MTFDISQRLSLGNRQTLPIYHNDKRHVVFDFFFLYNVDENSHRFMFLICFEVLQLIVCIMMQDRGRLQSSYKEQKTINDRILTNDFLQDKKVIL